MLKWNLSSAGIPMAKVVSLEDLQCAGTEEVDEGWSSIGGFQGTLLEPCEELP